jgi:Flp pilus assembly protein TadG
MNGIRARRRTRLRGRGRGQAAAEFAIVAPIFFFMLFGIIDFGRYVYYVQIINNAAREGARYAIVNGERSFTPVGPAQDDATVEAVVTNYAIGVIGADADLTVHSCWKNSGCPGDPMETPSNARGQKVRVSAQYVFHPILPLVPLPNVTINGESTLVINN